MSWPGKSGVERVSHIYSIRGVVVWTMVEALFTRLGIPRVGS